jgi:hypothetical protein
MEKLMYFLWKDEAEDRQHFSNNILRKLAPQLLATGAPGVQINVVDEAIRPAEHMLVNSTEPRYYAMVSLWLDTANARSPLEQLFTTHASRIAGYLVTESCPLPNTHHQVGKGERTPGFSQVALLQRPSRLTVHQWLATWLDSHTEVALSTQSTFLYRQNVVTRSLTETAPACDGIVEEAFPASAMTSQQTFYAAENNPERCAMHQRSMLESCARFIDFDKLDVCPTSEYNYRRFRQA